LVFSGIAFTNFESVMVKAVAVTAIIGAAFWAFYILRIKREDWILIEPHL
jgi:hypothetical protein